jgi:hypothetical protein
MVTKRESGTLTETQQSGATSRLASGAFLIRDYDVAVAIGRLTQQESMAKAWPRMLKLTAERQAVFVTEGGATVEILEERHAVLGPGVAECLVRVRFTDTADADLAGEFWLTDKALEDRPAT